MTVGNCISFCENQDYIYAGVEFTQECCPSTPSRVMASSSKLFQQIVVTLSILMPLMRPLVTVTCLVLEMLSRLVERADVLISSGVAPLLLLLP